jgi:hypothetical protein
MMDSRLPFNSPEMENPIRTSRRGVLTRSAAKALRQSSNHHNNVSSSLEEVGQTLKMNKPSTRSSPDTLTPPRRKVLFSDDTKGGDKENEQGSSIVRRTRAGTPFRSSKQPLLNEDDTTKGEDGITQSALYYSIPSITTTHEATTATLEEDESAVNSTSSSGWSVWVLHTLVLFVAAAWLINEHYSEQITVAGTSNDVALSDDTMSPFTES